MKLKKNLVKNAALPLFLLILIVAIALVLAGAHQAFNDHTVKSGLFPTADEAMQECIALAQNFTTQHPNAEPTADSRRCEPYQQIHQNGQWAASASFKGWMWSE